MKKDKIANVIMAYDSYSDIWEDYFNLMDIYWPDNNMPIYFVDLEMDCPYSKAITIKCGTKMNWTSRLKFALNNISQKYIYLSVEDFFYCRRISNIDFENAVHKMEKYNITYYRLVKYPHSIKNFRGIRGLKCINKNCESGINLQPAIWNKEYLLELLGDDDINAWEFEYNQTLKSRSSKSELFKNCVVDMKSIIKYRNEIIKGKHNLFSVLYFKSRGYKINLSNRDLMTIEETIVYYIRYYGYRVVPNFMKLSVRQFLRKFGFSFVDDKYIK